MPEVLEGTEMREDGKVDAESEESGERHMLHPFQALEAIKRLEEPAAGHIGVGREKRAEDRGVFRGNVDATRFYEHVTHIVVHCERELVTLGGRLRRAIRGNRLGPVRQAFGPFANGSVPGAQRRSERAEKLGPVAARADLAALCLNFGGECFRTLLAHLQPALSDLLNLVEAMLELRPDGGRREVGHAEQLADHGHTLVDGQVVGEGAHVERGVGVPRDQRIKEADGLVVRQESVPLGTRLSHDEATVHEEAAKCRPIQDVVVAVRRARQPGEVRQHVSQPLGLQLVEFHDLRHLEVGGAAEHLYLEVVNGNGRYTAEALPHVHLVVRDDAIVGLRIAQEVKVHHGAA
mmetsp:Transcript_78936/g.228161  ORF Transcript_78936/g.228161 Transcript_78936/m.228161 type:complete len:349 (-) Transcript_78936:404-1450(-)